LFSMFRPHQIALFSFAVGLLPGVLWATPQKTQKPHTVPVKSSSRPAAEPLAPPSPPAPPPTLEQLPAQPPQVSYLNGQLTIISRNSTLGDILHAVARQTGADIELPPGAGLERVAGRMGPGPARDVLAELLNGSRYDYVMVAAAANPGGLQHVILTPKPSGAGSSPAPVAAYQPQAAPSENDMPPETSADQQEIPPEDATPEEPPPPPTQAAPYDHAPGELPDNGGQPAPGVKTPQQLLQELQRMQQQQRQQQQQQNQPQ
jgi:hypothetical protein